MINANVASKQKPRFRLGIKKKKDFIPVHLKEKRVQGPITHERFKSNLREKRSCVLSLYVVFSEQEVLFELYIYRSFGQHN